MTLRFGDVHSEGYAKTGLLDMEIGMAWHSNEAFKV
jgi:hypothetical protein